ncbi:MAG: hypothetical protein JO072_10670, partial [Parafilimonas sp.]|nr:hypothetical protein [Parafilimonas sp.]
MKKIKILIAACMIFSYSILHAQKNADNGNWTISSINFEDKSMNDTLQNVPVFEDVNIKCLLNSNWDLSDNGEGSYKIGQQSSCTKGMRQISWMRFNLKGSNYFQFYRTSAVHGVTADKHSIYICEVSNSGKENFTLRYPIFYAGKQNAILFN